MHQLNFMPKDDLVDDSRLTDVPETERKIHNMQNDTTYLALNMAYLSES